MKPFRPLVVLTPIALATLLVVEGPTLALWPDDRLRMTELDPPETSHQVTSEYGLGLQTGCLEQSDTAQYHINLPPDEMDGYLVSGMGAWRVSWMDFTIFHRDGDHWIESRVALTPKSPILGLIIGNRVRPADVVIAVQAACGPNGPTIHT